MKKGLLKHAVTHIFRTPFFKLILLIFIIISIVLFLIQKEIVFPVFQKMQMASIESEATRTAQHLRNSLDIHRGQDGLVLPDDMGVYLQEIMRDFKLIKIKIFDTSGVVVYSSEDKEIGEVNTHDYFHEMVARGHVFSKIAKENQASMEGTLISVSVAEVYVPIISNDEFYGAFEIYYNITEQNKNIVRNEFVFTIVSFTTWLLLTLVFVALLVKASLANILKTKAQKELAETNHWLERAVSEKTREIKATQIISVQALATLAEHYDLDTGEHLVRIQLYVKTLLEQLITEANHYAEYVQRHSGYLEEIIFAALLHDIGKTAIPMEILTKPGKLTLEEFDIVKSHTTIAGEALNKANEIFREDFGKDSYLALARDIAIHHHEKWNGEGYPHRLKGLDIPLSARITAIADVYDALTSDRPYKKAWSHERAFEEIVNCSGSHFEPELVDVFKTCGEQFKRISGNTINKP